VNHNDDGRIAPPDANNPERMNDSPRVANDDRQALDRTRTSSSNELTYATARLRDRVLDGTRVWGSIDTGPDRQGFRRYRLVLFPPGMTKVERRLLRLWRALPTWGSVLWLMSVICLSQMYPPWTALGISTAGYIGVGAVMFHRLGVLRTQVRTLSAVLIAGYSDPGTAAPYAELKKLASILYSADALLEQGRISVTDHEAIWWKAYELVGQYQDTLNRGGQ
jgi:hypothetical protein